MSAPNAGRQSPEPEKQSNQQVGAPESGQVDAAPSDTHAKDASEDTKQNTLSSNPEGPMEGAAHEKVSKEGRGDVHGGGFEKAAMEELAYFAAD
ncbi:MAG: hypothetical protein Q9217_002348 [Psora testacea]